MEPNTPNSTESAPVSEGIDSVQESQENQDLAAEEVAEEAKEESKDSKSASSKEVKKEEQKKANKKKFKLKVDGKESEEEVDLDDEEYLTRQLQLAKAAQKRIKEHSDLQKEVAMFIDQLKKDPRKVLSDPNIGIDIKQLAAQIIEEDIANSQKSPEQLEKEKLEARLRELEDERKREKEEYERKEIERLQQQEYERYDLLITQALEKSDLPKSPYVVKKIADYMLLGLQNNLDVTPEDILPMVREEMVSDLKEMFAVMPDEVVEAIVGKDVINRIRKKSVAKAKEKGIPPTPVSKAIPDTGAKKNESKESGKKMTLKEFFGV